MNFTIGEIKVMQSGLDNVLFPEDKTTVVVNRAKEKLRIMANNSPGRDIEPTEKELRKVKCL